MPASRIDKFGAGRTKSLEDQNMVVNLQFIRSTLTKPWA